MLKSFVTKLLKKLARRRLAKSNLKIIAISGSAGKTTTRDAVSLALEAYGPTLKSPKNYNNEFGVPLTILGEQTPSNALGWLGVLRRAKQKSKQALPYQFLVLEFGIDGPGDMNYLLDIVQPDIALLTNIGRVHLEAFADQKSLDEEKLSLLRGVKEDGIAIINQDDPVLAESKSSLKTKVISFGKNGADINFTIPNPVPGSLEFSFSYPGKGEDISIKTKLLSQHQGYILAASLAVVSALKLDPGKAVLALSNLEAPAGRETLLSGVKDTLLIDSTYNSSPTAAKAMLKTLQAVSQNKQMRPVAILGDMLELGADEEKAHLELIEELRSFPLAIVVAKAFQKALASLAEKPTNIHGFAKSEDVIDFLKENIKTNDCLLFKASQGIRLEKALIHFLKNPEDSKLLVRQEAAWQK